MFELGLDAVALRGANGQLFAQLIPILDGKLQLFDLLIEAGALVLQTRDALAQLIADGIRDIQEGPAARPARCERR